MKRMANLWAISLGMWGLGFFTMMVRRRLYSAAVDGTGLLPGGSPLAAAVLLLALAALALAVFACCLPEGRGVSAPGFRGGLLSFAGYTAAGAGILITVLLNQPLLPGRIGLLWKLLGCVSPVCLFLGGFARFRGKPVAFVLHAIPCAFLAIHMVDHYQLWCSNPQIQDYLLALFGTVALTLLCYQLAAADAGKGNRRNLVFWCLLAQFLCLGELAVSRELYLYAGGFCWAAASLWTLQPEEGGM